MSYTCTLYLLKKSLLLFFLTYLYSITCKKVIWDPDLHSKPNLAIICYLNDFAWAPSLFIGEGFSHLPLRSLFVRMMYKSIGVSVRVSPRWQDRDLSLPLTALSLHSEAESRRCASHSPACVYLRSPHSFHSHTHSSLPQCVRMCRDLPCFYRGKYYSLTSSRHQLWWSKWQVLSTSLALWD